MLLKKKILLILLLTFLVFASLNYAVHHYIILPGFESLEISEAKKDMDRCVGELRDEINHVDILCHDWSAWDDLYNFMASPSPGFVRKNFNIDKIVNNRLSLVCITDTSGKAIFCESWNLPKGERTLLKNPSETLRHLSSFPESSPADSEELSGVRNSGIYNSDRGPMLISARPILNSKNQGPARGALVFGRLLDKTFIEQFTDRVEVAFSVIGGNDDVLTEEEKKIIREPDSDKVRIVEINDSNSLFAYSRLKDIGGGEDFIARAEIPRYILKKGRTTFFYSFILITILGLFMVFQVIILLRRIILSPVMILTDHVLGVVKTGDLSAHISLPQNDEFGILGRELNRMLEQMAKQTAELAGMNVALITDIEKRKRVEQELRESEQRFRRLHEASFGGISIHDEGRIIDANQGLSTITGFETRELIGMDGLKLIASPWVETVQSNITNDYEQPYDVEGIRKDGSVYPLEIQGKVIPYKGRMVRVTEFRDISSRKAMELRLKSALDELEAVIENGQMGIMVLQGARVLYKGNQRLADILGYDSPETMVGISMRQLHISETNFIEFGEKYSNLLVQGEQIQVEYELRRRDGTALWCTLSGKAIDRSVPPDPEKGVVWMIDDISEKRQNQEKLRQLATTDYLTGLFNRRYFMEIASVELERQKRYSHYGLSLIMLDIDYFKAINDTHGHDIGDVVLKAFAEIGRKNFRDVDIFARIGGEEFAALLPDTEIKGALAIAERFRQAVETGSVNTDKRKISFTVSLGVATWDTLDQSIESIMKKADQALYAAKKNGRNRVESFEEQG